MLLITCRCSLFRSFKRCDQENSIEHRAETFSEICTENRSRFALYSKKMVSGIGDCL